MLKINNINRLLSIAKNRFTHSLGLTLATKQSFTLANRKTQLILHSDHEIVKIHNKKQNKDKAWETIK